MELLILAETTLAAVIHAPLDSIDLTDWVYGITDAEYQACPKDHIAAAASRTADGKRMSINIERVGRLIVQHYVEDIFDRAHCRLVSVSDAFGPGVGDRGQFSVLWEFPSRRSTRRPPASPTTSKSAPAMTKRYEQQGPMLEQVRQRSEAALVPHNTEETALFAQDIERKALQRRWPASRRDPGSPTTHPLTETRTEER